MTMVMNNWTSAIVLGLRHVDTDTSAHQNVISLDSGTFLVSIKLVLKTCMFYASSVVALLNAVYCMGCALCTQLYDNINIRCICPIVCQFMAAAVYLYVVNVETCRYPSRKQRMHSTMLLHRATNLRFCSYTWTGPFGHESRGQIKKTCLFGFARTVGITK